MESEPCVHLGHAIEIGWVHCTRNDHENTISLISMLSRDRNIFRMDGKHGTKEALRPST
jgi:hypothetical protein